MRHPSQISFVAGGLKEAAAQGQNGLAILMYTLNDQDGTELPLQLAKEAAAFVGNWFGRDPVRHTMSIVSVPGKYVPISAARAM